MPVYLRKFYFKELVSAKSQEKKQIDKISKNTTTVSNKGITTPKSIKSNYQNSPKFSR